MASNRPWSAFEHTDPESGLPRVVIRLPKGAAEPPRSVTVMRGFEPRFLTSTGWADTAEDLPVAGGYTSVDARYMAFDPAVFADVEDYEHIEIRIPGTDLNGVTAWPPEPAPHESLQVRDDEGGRRRPEAEQGGEDRPVFEVSGADEGDSPGLQGRNPGFEKEEEDPLEPAPRRRWPWWIWLVLGVLAIALIVSVALWFDRTEKTKVPCDVDPTSQSCVTPPPPPPPPPPLAACETDEACFRAALEEGHYATARRLLDGLVAQGSPDVALIAAEALGADPFEPGLFDAQNHRRAFQYYRNACAGGAKARASVAAWAARLAETEPPSAAIVQAAGNLTETCKD